MKLPRTLHIEGSRMPVGKTDPEAIQFNNLSGQFLVIEEKVDGTGVSIELDTHLNLDIKHRGKTAGGEEFKELHKWASRHWEDLLLLLGERYVLFGEWMYHKHTIFYDNLPHYFLESDVYDKERQIWLSTSARNTLLKGQAYLKQVPVIAAIKPTTLYQITKLIGPTRFKTDNWKQNLCNKYRELNLDSQNYQHETDMSNLMEGLYIKHENDFEVVGRYKYVRYEFLQNILNSGTHLIDRIPITNSIG